MAFLKIPNVSIRGISGCVPSNIEENISLPIFNEGEAVRVIKQTGIERKHILSDGVTTSDLCSKAFEKLLFDLKWDRESIDALVFVSLAPDYVVPPTSCVLQGKLGLSNSCYTLDIRHGCPGWVIALSNIASMVSLGNFHRAILLCGDSPSFLNSLRDKETRPLFSDAGTATALEYNKKAECLDFEIGTNGKDFKAIWMPYGGQRNPITIESLQYVKYGEHKERRGVDVEMDGMNVFSFGLSVAPKSVNSLCEHFCLNKNEIDYYVFHQANHYMNEKIRKKLKIEIEKTPYSLKNFGNTSCASIPLTIVTQCNKKFQTEKLNNIGCAFGVGLSWGTVYFQTNKIVCPDLILY